LLHRKHGHPVLLPTNGACIEVVWDQGIGELVGGTQNRFELHQHLSLF
jgi:hypothetical protein